MKTRPIVHIVGNRPQFIKLAPITKEFRKRGRAEIIIHTGQHYDENMSDIFFEELEIPKPDTNLGIGSGTHAEMTGRAMIGIEKALQEYGPGCVVLYGDTDSTLAGALAAVKLEIPIIHVEAGIRTGTMKNPEETNRIVTDHLADILFCSDKDSYVNLVNEGIGKKAYQVGDVMYDTFLQYKDKRKDVVLRKYDLEDDQYLLMTWHRQENTQNREIMLKIVQFLENIEYLVVCPIHPRTKMKLLEYGLWDMINRRTNILLIPPVGYLDMISLMSGAHLILTDSGGVSKESFFAGTKCILMVNLNLWPNLMENRWIIQLDVNDQESIRNALLFIEQDKKDGDICHMPFYGTGNAAIRIADILQEKLLL